MTLAYKLVLEPDGDTIRVECPSLPELNTFGDYERDALHHAIDAAETVLHFYIMEGRPIPPSDAAAHDRSAVHLSLLVSLKLDLYEACRAAGVTRAELARRLGWHREQVDRLFRLNHASRLDQIEAAFSAVGCVIDLQVRAAA